MSSHTSVESKESGFLPQDNLDSIEKRVVRRLNYIRVIPFAFIIILLHVNKINQITKKKKKNQQWGKAT
jgi:uncharacterized protein YnzC (UPF0291/DUF896 family)